MPTDKPTLAWCSPNYGPIETEVYKEHMAVIAHASRTFDVKFVGVTDKMYLHSASNALVDAAIKSGVDYVFWTEMDMLPPFDAIERLYANRKEICGGLYFLRGAGYQPCMYKRHSETAKDSYGFIAVSIFPENECIKMDAIGFGCVLIKVDTLRKLDFPYFDIGEQKCGQDMYFYKKCYDKGIGVYVDTGVQCEQLSSRTRTSIADYRQWLKSPEAQAGGFIEHTKAQK